MAPVTLNAGDVAAAVRRRYGAERDGLGPEWACLDELTLGRFEMGERRADLFLVRAWSGQPKGHERHLVEVKVSRADLRAELAAPELHLVRGRPVTSETIWVHSAPWVPPPTATTRSMRAPAPRSASTLWRTPKAVASRTARYRSPPVWDRVRPAITPRASGSKTGVRSPAKYGRASRPRAPGPEAAASARSVG